MYRSVGLGREDGDREKPECRGDGARAHVMSVIGPPRYNDHDHRAKRGNRERAIRHQGLMSSVSSSGMVLTVPSTYSLRAPAPSSEAGVLAQAATAP